MTNEKFYKLLDRKCPDSRPNGWFFPELKIYFYGKIWLVCAGGVVYSSHEPWKLEAVRALGLK